MVRFVWIFALFAFSVQGQSQSEALFIQFFGTVKSDIGKRLSEAKVEVYQNGKLTKTSYTDSLGKYNLTQHLIQGNYKIRYSRKDHVSKYVEINTEDMLLDSTSIGTGYPMPIDLSLFENDETIDFSILNVYPVGKARYDLRVQEIVWDFPYTRSIMNRVKKLNTN
jgi:hypothetical protein